MNKYYHYKYKELWGDEAWQDRASKTNPLAQWLEGKEREARCKRRCFSAFGTPGEMDLKTHSIPIAELIESWRSKGLDYFVREMGGIRWVTMLPHICSRNGVHDPIVLLVLCDADYTSAYWSMDILDRYADYCEYAAKEQFVLLLVASDGIDSDNSYVRILQESAAIFHIRLRNVYMDIHTVYSSGACLKEISGLEEAETIESQLCGIPVIDITNLWQNRVSQVYATVLSPKAKALGFLPERITDSPLGRRMAESMLLQANFSGGTDPELKDFWLRRGLRYDRHAYHGEPWVVMCPASVGSNAQKLPLIIVMQEVTDDNPHATLIAMSYHYGLLDIAASGDAIVLFFALECPEDNEILCDIIEEAKKRYCIDERRIYITGHSHNGMYSLIFAQRHPALFAGIATLGNSHGLIPAAGEKDPFNLTDQALETFLTYDMPLININGELENPFAAEQKTEADRKALFAAWQRRLKYFVCPVPSWQAFSAVPDAPSKAVRKLGICGGQVTTRYLNGFECYTMDVTNSNGRQHLRFVTIEDMIHLNVPIMADLSWEFLRRFSRDPVSGSIIEE